MPSRDFVMCAVVSAVVLCCATVSLAHAAGEPAGLESAADEVRQAGQARRHAAKEVKQAVQALKKLVKRGVPVKHARDVVTAAIGQGLKGHEVQELGEALGRAGRDANYDVIGQDVQRLLTSGLRGRALATAIHQRIAARQAERGAAKVEQHRQRLEEQRRKMEERHRRRMERQSDRMK